MAAFTADVIRLRENYLRESAAISLSAALNNPKWRGEPHAKLFLGAVTTVKGDGDVVVNEETEEQRAMRRKMIQDAEQAINKVEAAKAFQEFYQEHGTPEYIGEEIITIGPVKSTS